MGTRDGDETSEETIRREYGTAGLTPQEEVVTGSFGTWVVTYTVGAVGMDDGSTLKLASNMSSDWGRPQFDDPQGDNYATVETSGDAAVEAAYDPDGHVRPLKDTVTVDVFDGSLGPGDAITVTLGETKEGSMGHRAQTFPEREFELAVLVDAFESGEFVRLPEDLTFDVVPGHARRLVPSAPSNADIDEAFEVAVRAEDYWGNAATDYVGTLGLHVADTASESDGRAPDAGIEAMTADRIDLPSSIDATDGVARLPVSADDEGVVRLEVVDEARGFTAAVNPVVVGADGRRTFWGDIHGQSGETVGTGTIEEYFEYLREKAHMQFAAHAGNDFQITDEFWEIIREQTATNNDPGEFVTFLCYEWSPNTAIGGDHNVYFKGDSADIHRSSSWQIADGFDKHEGIHPAADLYEMYAGRDDVLLIPHQGGRPATLDTFDPDLTPFVEIASVWGVFEWFGREALDRGYEVGFVGGSDDHTGRPGASYPTNKADWTFPIKGPVMAAKADDLTRESLWEAFEKRRVYASTGARILLALSVGGAGMGESVTVDGTAAIDVSVRGTAPLSRVDLFRGSELLATEQFDEDDLGTDGADRVELTWTGARSKTRHKVQEWSGGLTLSAGRILNAEEAGFDHPTQGITERTDTTLRWEGGTAGNYQSVRLSLDAPADAELAVRSGPVSESFTLGDIDNEGTVVNAGHLDRRLSVRRVGESITTDATVSFVDAPAEGRHAYYVRVRQIDGEMAWSSPVFLTHS
jgi:hypothetical protein